MLIYVITAVGVGIDTEVHITKNNDEAKTTCFEILNDFGVDRKEIEEMTSCCWKGYSKKAGCDVEVEIHEKYI